jgi:hypothetical protein
MTTSDDRQNYVELALVAAAAKPLIAYLSTQTTPVLSIIDDFA